MGVVSFLGSSLAAWGLLHAAIWLYSKAARRPSLLPPDSTLTSSPLQVRYVTKGLNPLFRRVGLAFPHFFQVWFLCGTVFGLIAMVSSILLLCYSIYSSFSAAPEEQILTPVLPGFNLPNSHLLYYFLALMVSGIFHEAGHAVAATSQGVTMNGFGVFLLFIYPGAFVDLCIEGMLNLSASRQLRVYCAGVWHNFIGAALAGLLLLGLPILLFPFYSSFSVGGVVVVHVPSTLQGHVFPGSLIERVDDCRVNNSLDWQTCISESYFGKSLIKAGSCVPRQHIAVLPEEIYNCCNDTESLSSSSLCFVRRNPAEDPHDDLTEACLPVRQTVSNPECDFDSDCNAERLGRGLESVCLFPSLREGERLVKLYVRDDPVVFFLGDPRFLYYAMQISNFQPRLSILPVSAPGMIEMFLKYTLSLSSALALLNMVPAYNLDGQWALMAFVDICLPKTACKTKKTLADAILISGSALFTFSILISFYTML